MSDESTTESGKKRPYTMSEEALEQRRQASLVARDHATGPKTEEGKAASSRNAWKHGLRSRALSDESWKGIGALFGKPCRTTCRHYPCSMVEDELTKPGEDCLDKTVYVQAFDSLLSAMKEGNIDSMHGALASEAAGAFELLHNIREHIAEKGLTIFMPALNKNGEAICYTDPDTGETKTAGTYGVNPLFHHYAKLLADLGINLPELLATPRAHKKAEGDGDARDAFADMMGRLANLPGGRHAKTIDGEVAPDE